MTTYDTDPDRALRATVTASETGGIQVVTTGVTTEPGVWSLAIAKGQTWNLYVRWLSAGTAVDMSGGTVTLTARTEAGGSAVFSVMGSANAEYAVFQQTAGETTALDFVRARYVLDYTTSSGDVTRLFGGPMDLTNPGMA